MRTTINKAELKTNLTQYAGAVVLVLASVRGAIVYHLGVGANATYSITAALLVGFGILSCYTLVNGSFDRSLVFFRNAVIVNIFAFGFYSVASIVFSSFSNYVLAYMCIIFPIVFLLVEYKLRVLEGVVHMVSAITAFGVYYFYTLGVTLGFESFSEATLILRPGELAYSRVGENLLPGGYQAEHHDAANILVMSAAFYISKAVHVAGTKGLFFFAAAFAVMFSILLTASAANIVVLFFGVCLSLLFIAKKSFLLVFLLAMIFVFYIFDLAAILGDYLYVLEKLSTPQSVLQGGGMFNSLDSESIGDSIFSAMFGYGNIFEVPMISSEVAFVKILITVGIAPFLLLCFILFSPVFCMASFAKFGSKRALELDLLGRSDLQTKLSHMRRNSQKRLLVACVPVMVGSLTLLHYGSLFRVTSVGLFCVFLALFYKQYVSEILELSKLIPVNGHAKRVDSGELRV